jgi:hypothetical protein
MVSQRVGPCLDERVTQVSPDHTEWVTGCHQHRVCGRCRQGVGVCSGWGDVSLCMGVHVLAACGAVAAASRFHRLLLLLWWW